MTTTVSFTDLAQQIHDNAAAKGFWHEGMERDRDEMLMLAVSELSEALEEHRAGRPARYKVHAKGCPNGGAHTFDCTVCVPKPEGIAVELADCFIRCMDYQHALGGDIDAMMQLWTPPLPANFAGALFQITRALTGTRDAMLAARWCLTLIERFEQDDAIAVIREKMQYNTTRPPMHGKAY